MHRTGKHREQINSSGVFFAPGEEPRSYWQNQADSLARRKPFQIVIVIGLLALTLASTFVSYHLARLTAIDDFERILQPIALRLERRTATYVNLVSSAKALVDADGTVDLAKFSRFFSSLAPAESNRGLRHVSFIERSKEPGRPEGWVVRFIEPQSTYRNLLGLDLLHDPIRLGLLEAARDEGGIATSVITIPTVFDVASRTPRRTTRNSQMLSHAVPQNEGAAEELTAPSPSVRSDLWLSEIVTSGRPLPWSESSVVFTVPVYRGAAIPPDVLARREALVGFFSVQAGLETLAGDLLDAFAEVYQIRVDLYESSRDKPALALIRESPKGAALAVQNPELTKDLSFPVGDRVWTVRFTALPSSTYFFQRYSSAVLVLTLGLSVTLLITYVLSSSHAGRQRLLRLVMSKSAELHNANALMMESLDRVPMPLYLKDGADLTIQYWNRAMEELSGVSRSEILGTTGAQLFAPEHAARFLDTDRKVLRTGKLLTVEEQLRTPSGEHKPILAKKVRVHSSEDCAYLLGIAEDLSKRQKEETERILNQKLQAVGSLASGIAHEINTPMQYVSLNMQYLRDSLATLTSARTQSTSEISAGTAKTLQNIDETIRQSIEGVERVISIVRALRDLSHPGTAERKGVSLEKLVQDAALISTNEWRPVAQLAIQHDVRIPELCCFPNELAQVFINLISNAAHAIEERKHSEVGRIVISTTLEGERVKILVADNGVGIPEKNLQKIYDPFFTTKDVGRGTGQGLSIARAIVVDRHGGSISCESKVGVGTTFTIHLPLSPQEPADAEMRIC